ncbi:type II toxin-antitoxin system RatA family toxin [Rhodobacterales bacterium HKCCSP123]|nr:type II toxin-antitoxin system RatA family toxin [Rhodobacterales bacterium HKCCSP123]
MPTHSETRRLPYSPEQMYQLVADVARYPQFIPWISAARVRSVTPEGDHAVMLADLVIGFKMFRERFLSRVTMWEDTRRIDTEYVDGPFKHMISKWEFAPAPDGDAGCEVRFAVDFEFRNKILQGAAGLFFHEAMQRIVRAFESRAEALYGTSGAAANA